MTDIRTFPYRRDIRPPNAEGLGEHTDREFEKIESAVARIAADTAALAAAVEAIQIALSAHASRLDAIEGIQTDHEARIFALENP